MRSPLPQTTRATAQCYLLLLNSRASSVQRRTVGPKIPSAMLQTNPSQYLSHPTSARHSRKELESHTNKTRLHPDPTAQSAALWPLQFPLDPLRAILNPPETPQIILATPPTPPSQPVSVLVYVLPPQPWPDRKQRLRRNEDWPSRGLRHLMATEPPSKKRSRQNVCLPSKPHLHPPRWISLSRREAPEPLAQMEHINM